MSVYDTSWPAPLPHLKGTPEATIAVPETSRRIARHFIAACTVILYCRHVHAPKMQTKRMRKALNVTQSHHLG